MTVPVRENRPWLSTKGLMLRRPWFKGGLVNIVLAPRLAFQWEWIDPPVLNAGCQVDPGMLNRHVREITHLDVERSEAPFGDEILRTPEPFVQADLNALPFADGSFRTVLLGDVLEHVANPVRCLSEAYRVASHRVVLTVPTRVEGDPGPDTSNVDQFGRYQGCHGMTMEVFQSLLAPYAAQHRIFASETGNESPPGWGAVIFKQDDPPRWL